MQTLRSIARAAALALGLTASALAGAQTLDTRGGRDFDLPVRFDPDWLGDADQYTSLFDFDDALKGARLFIDGPAEISLTVVGTEAPDLPKFGWGHGGWGWGHGGWHHAGWGHGWHPHKGGKGHTAHTPRSPFTLGDSLSFEQASAGRIPVLSWVSELVGKPFYSPLNPFALVLADDGKSALLFFETGFGRRDFDDLVVRLTVTPVPEPESALLWLAGLAGMGAWLRRRHRANGSVQGRVQA